MIWPWSRKEPNVVPTVERDSDGQRAIERALLAQREAGLGLDEMRARAERSRKELSTNNFAGDIWNAMKRRPKNEH